MEITLVCLLNVNAMNKSHEKSYVFDCSSRVNDLSPFAPLYSDRAINYFALKSMKGNFNLDLNYQLTVRFISPYKKSFEIFMSLQLGNMIIPAK